MSAIALVNWTAAGTDMVDPDGICLRELVRGGPNQTAKTRGDADTIPALAGLQPRLFEAERRTIEFRGFVRGVGATETLAEADYWANGIALATLLDPTQIIELVITLPGGAQYSINARPIDGDPQYTEIVPNLYATVSTTFESFDPDWVAAGS